MSDPYAEYKDNEIPSDKLDMLTALADGWKDATEEVERCAAELSTAQAKVRVIEEQDIPEIMDVIELETFTTKSGLKISVKETVRCSIPKAQQPDAFAWLRVNGHGRLIKRKLSIDFAMGEEDQAQAFLDLNLSAKPDLEISDAETIANPTLVKFVREKSEAGEALPTDLFPVFRQRVAKIK